MPGIIVGIDGSAHSRQALEWAVNEASVRHAPLTVLTVNQAAAGHWSRPVEYPGDLHRTKQAREAARMETDSVLKQVGNESWLPLAAPSWSSRPTTSDKAPKQEATP
jgi:nucleotide-binding universal stress UspA family protein